MTIGSRNAMCQKNGAAPLESFGAKRLARLSWIDTDEHHAIWTVLSSMVWTDVSFRTLAQFAIAVQQLRGSANSLELRPEGASDAGWATGATLAAAWAAILLPTSAIRMRLIPARLQLACQQLIGWVDGSYYGKARSAA
jgi:hypothetical protein